MASFRYQARIPDGRIQAGIVEAPNLEYAQQALEERQYEVLQIETARESQAAASTLLALMNSVKVKELVGTVRMLSVMISASVPLTDAVRNLARQTKNPYFKRVLVDVANEVEGGAKLSDALERYPRIFSAFFTNMVRSGETTGQLAEVMNYLADQQERDYDTRSKLKGALTYPIFIVVSMFIVGIVMMVYVVPKLTKTLIEAGAELPLPTRLLIGASDFMVAYWWVILIGLGIFGTVLYFWRKTPYGRYTWDSLVLKIPIMGQLIGDMYLVRFTQAMSTLMKGGMTITQSLEVTAGVMENYVWKKMVLDTIQSVNDGEPITSVMARTKTVPTMAVQMLTVGEEAGKMNEVLVRLSDFYQRSLANTSANILSLLEPLIMVVLGLGVGIMVAAIMLPMYNLSSATG